MRTILIFLIAVFLNTNLSYTQEIITYKVKTKSYVRHAKGEEKLLTDFDRIRMRSYEETDSFFVSIDTEGEITKTIFHLASTQFPDWAIMPSKTVIDSLGLCTFDKHGNILTKFLHGEEAQETRRMIKEFTKMNGYNYVAAFTEISEAAFTEMRLQGALFKKGTNGEVHVRKGNTELLYDVKNHTVENREFDSTNHLTHSLRRQFTKDDQGRLIPFYQREVNLKHTPQGRRLWYITEQFTSNYKRDSLSKATGANEVREPYFKLIVYPNPAANEITVDISPALLAKNPIAIILDAAGKEIFRSTLIASKQQLSVKTMAGGIYLLQVLTPDGLKKTIRFIKH